MTLRKVTGERFQLLSTFKAIFDKGSLGKAAEIQHITQSAASKHLQKLRDWFDDELFVRTSMGMKPTAKALSIIVQVSNILDDMASLNAVSHFDPKQIQGSFTIATSDEITQRLLPKLLTLLADQAPKMRLSTIALTADYAMKKLETGQVNLVIGLNCSAPDQLIQKRLFSDKFVCLMSRRHPLAKQNKLNLKDYANASHIMVAPFGSETGLVDEQLGELGYKRFIRASVPGFSHVSYQLIGEHSIISLPSYVAEQLCQSPKLMIKPLPYKMSMSHYYIFWHRRFSQENVNLWMREKIESILVKDSSE